VSRRARPLLIVVRGATALEVGVDAAQAEAEAKRVSSVTLLFGELGASEGVGMSFENNSSSCDPAPLMLFMTWRNHRMGINRGGSPRFLSLHISRGRMLYRWRPVKSIRTRLSFTNIGHQSRKVTQLDIQAPTETCTHRCIVSDSGSCCSESEPKNQYMTVS